jgi:hypothetical protein
MQSIRREGRIVQCRSSIVAGIGIVKANGGDVLNQAHVMTGGNAGNDGDSPTGKGGNGGDVRKAGDGGDGGPITIKVKRKRGTYTASANGGRRGAQKGTAGDGGNKDGANPGKHGSVNFFAHAGTAGQIGDK